jgi:hypothetical protein
LNEGRRKKEEVGLYIVDSDPKSKQATLRTVGVLTRTARDKLRFVFPFIPKSSYNRSPRINN